MRGRKNLVQPTDTDNRHLLEGILLEPTRLPIGLLLTAKSGLLVVISEDTIGFVDSAPYRRSLIVAR